MPKYNKLVRDKIPSIIESKGEKPITKILDAEEYIRELNRKLQEELLEFLQDNTAEELADMLEVIYAIANTHHISIEELERIREQKKEDKGGFEKKIFLIETC
jgi:predicted house-cleaning noncanonical NTP pyrophosphatase (MazG superfamily)